MTTVSDQNSAKSGSLPMTELFLHSSSSIRLGRRVHDIGIEKESSE